AHGGLATILWHTRSLSPERLWGDAYARLIRELERRKAWFGTAAQVAAWFRRRRQAAVTKVSVIPAGLRAEVSDPAGGAEQLALRISVPGKAHDGLRSVIVYEAPWTGSQVLHVQSDSSGVAARREVAAL
ncbi:MAG: hypothetical protein V2A34_01145, partial [Lentisphaerota bacterium]